jgi:ketosteroid isomerase-like protein
LERDPHGYGFSRIARANGAVMPPDATALTAVAERFLSAFNGGDLAGMRATLSDDAVAYITGPDGNRVRVDGADGYVAAVAEMNLPAVDYSVTLTQPPVVVDADQVLVMVEVRARRGERALQNYAAHLLRIADGRITELHMVDAKPAESDAFWA